MNIINKLTLRQLKLNKKRTLVTIIGVIISVAMITAVATLGVSYMDLMKRQTISNDGEWHVLYKNVSKNGFEAIKNDKNTKSLILSKDIGYAPLDESINKNKPYIFIREYSSEGFEKFPIELTDGRFPQNSNEIVISEAIITNAKVNYNIGDVLTLDIGNRYSKISDDKNTPLMQDSTLQILESEVNEDFTKTNSKTYTIVGIIKRPNFEPTSSPGYTVLSYLDGNAITNTDKVNISVILNSVTRDLFESANNIAQKSGVEEPSFNNTLLRYYGVVKDGSLRRMLFTLSAIIIAIIMVGSISLIYNAFSISVSERSRYLGMLSSVGATKIQKRNSVFFEGAIIGAISIPLGIIFGLGGIGITFFLTNSLIQGALGVTESFRLVISPISLLSAAIVSIVTIFISTYIPAKRASNVSAIDAIRQTSDLKLTGKEIKTSKLTRKIFGIEGDIGLKNLKRNKARYKATVFSLSISLILFLSVTSFTSGLKKSVEMSQEGINFDIHTSLNINEKEVKEDLIEKIKSLDHIKSLTRVDNFDAKLLVDKQSIADYIKDSTNEILEEGKYPYYIAINALDDETLASYAKEVGADINRLKNTENPASIVIDTVNYKDMETNKYIETKSIKTSIGEKLNLIYYNYEEDRNEPINTDVEVITLTDKLPMGVMSRGANATFNIIVSKEVFDMITNSNENINRNITTSIVIKSDNPMKLQEDIETIKNTSGEPDIYITNAFMGRQKEEQLILLMSVFIYGFILLITSICIANIFNTISTSIALRKREFAMLKSVGMTPQSFNKMINYESIFYGIKSLIYGLPISFVLMYYIHITIIDKFNFNFSIPWGTILIAVTVIFAIVTSAMLYSSAKIKKENIIDALRKDFI